MAKDNSTSKTRENINERIMVAVRQRLQTPTISVDVSQKLAELCTRWGTTPEDLIKGFIADITLDVSASCDPYPVFFHQAAFKYLSIAHGRTRIIQNGKYTERPEKRTFN